MKLIFLLSVALLTTRVYAQQTATDSVHQTVTIKEDYKDDWADLHHYEAENKLLPQPTPGSKRVVFLGSSIFERWKQLVPQYFNNSNYLDRGISGQISPQLLLRFRQDVIALKPKAVVILAGSNDIAGSTGHVTNERIMDNVESMVELAQLHHIKVILCAYLPVYDYPWRKGLQPANKIIALNQLIKKYAVTQHLTLLDYFTPFADSRNGQKAELTMDGVHPNVAGYQIMAKLTDEAIEKTLK